MIDRSAQGPPREPTARPSCRKCAAWLALAALLAAAAILAIGLTEARSDPVVRRIALGLPDWPAGAQPVRVALIADLHLCGATMRRERLARINRVLRSLDADLVLIAGDFVARLEPYSARCAARAVPSVLMGLRPRLGTVAVLGNHDNWSDSLIVAQALADAGVTVVENSAVRRGPLLIGGVGDTVSGHAHLGGTLLALARLRREGPGATVFMSHSPDIVRWLPRPALLVAGHTHCGQIVLPLIGGLFEVSRENGNTYRCGAVRRNGRTVIVTAGLGTSHAPLRLGAPPDVWLTTLGPAHRAPG